MTEPELGRSDRYHDAVVHGPGHTMGSMPEATNRPDLVEEYDQTIGTILGECARNPVQGNRP